MAAALGAERLGLPHNPPDAVARTRDKAAMREALAAAGIPQPRFALLGPAADVGAAAAHRGLPVRAQAAGAVGQSRRDPGRRRRAGAPRRASASEGFSPSRTSLPRSRSWWRAICLGVEVAVEGLLRAGRLEVLAVFDKPDPLEGPYFEETLIRDAVAVWRPPSSQRSRRSPARAARALGLHEGPIHAELRVDGDRVSVLELAAARSAACAPARCASGPA